MSDVNLTLSLVKTEICHAVGRYLHCRSCCSYGRLKPVLAKADAILKFPVPQGMTKLIRFLGMEGYNRKFYPSFLTNANPLILNLFGMKHARRHLSKSKPFIWFSSSSFQFKILKKERVLQIDANDVGCGAVLLQEYEDDICQ